MESGRLSSNRNLETVAMLENLGGCCEGTVFTFTSAGSRWKLRQRLNRNKASLVCPPGRLPVREDPADSVFTEMRIMPRSSDPHPSTGVDLSNHSMVLNFIRTEDSSRANSVANYDASDMKDNRSVKKLTGQVGVHQGKVFLQEAVKADHERRELQVSTEETTLRKSRRYLRCDVSKERLRYGDAAEDSKIWTWNEKKLEEVRAQELSKEASYQGNKPAEERRNKRESSAEDIHVFEQRKVKCRRREQDSCSTPSKSVQNERGNKFSSLGKSSFCTLSKADNDKRASYGFNHRQGAPEDPRKQQAVPAAAICPCVADELTKSRRGSSVESAETIGDNCLKNIAKQKPVFELHIQRGNVTEENRSWMTPRPSTPPIASSFISFKEGVSCVGNRRCHLLGNASMRARRLLDMEHSATAPSDGNEIQFQILRDNKLVHKSSARALSISPNRTSRILELSFPRRNTEMDGGDAQTKTGRTGRPEALNDTKSTERDKIVLSEIEAGNSSHTVLQVVPFHQRPMSKELSSSWSSMATEASLDRGGDALSSWEGRHFSVKPKNSSVNEGETGTSSVDISQPHPPRVKEGPRGRLSLSLLDCHSSFEVNGDLETTDLDGNDQRSNERYSDDEFTPEREADGPSSAQGREEARDDICEGPLDGMNTRQLAEVNYVKPSGVPNKYADDGNTDLEEKLRCEIASNNLRKSTKLELQNQSFREADADIPDGRPSTKRSCPSRSEKVRTEIVDLDPLLQKSVSLRRQPWVKGLKKKTAEKVSYFESWLGRSRKLQKTSSGRKCGTKGVGELSQAHRVVEKHAKSRPFGHSIDQHLMSQAWSKKESQAYVTKEFAILEAVLQSEVNVDDDESEAADYLQHAGIRSSAGLSDVDKEEGRWQPGGTMTGKRNCEELDVVSMSTVATNLETEDNLVQLTCTNGNGLLSERGEYPEAENSQQPHWSKMSRICKNVADLNSLGEQEWSHLGGFSNSTGGHANECWQEEKADDSPALSHSNSAAEGLNVTIERQSLKPEDVRDCRVISEKVLKTSLERSRDKDMRLFPQSKDIPCCTRNARNIGLAEQSCFLLEKGSRNQAHKGTGAHHQIGECVKPVHHLRVLNDSRDKSRNKALDRIGFAVGEMNIADRFGGLATEILGPADLASVSRMATQNSCPSYVTSASGNLPEVVDSLVQIESIQHNPFNKTSSTFSQQVPSPLQETSVPDIFEHGKQVKSSTVKVLQSARDVVDEDNFALKSVSGTDVGQSTGRRRVEILESQSSSVMVGFEDKAESTDDYSFRAEATGEFGGLTESETTHDTVDLKSRSVTFTSEVDFDHFPSSIKALTEKEIFGAERKKESPVNRRHKMPIIVRVRNRLANGWLLQHPLWKRVAKHKTKTGDAQIPATKGINQTEVHANPSSLTSGQSCTGDSITDVPESRTEIAIHTNPPSKHDTESTGTSKSENLIVEAHHQTRVKAKNEKSNQGPLGDLDTCRYQLNIDDMENPSVSEKYEIVKQKQVNKEQAPLRNDDEVERDHTKKDECPGQASSVLSFTEWQSRAKGFGKSSPFRKRVEANSVSTVTESETELIELGKSDKLNDAGELPSVVCLGNSVQEATVLGTFSDFDAHCEVPIVLRQGNVERDSTGFKKVSGDICSGVIPAFCRGKREKVSAVSQTSSDYSAFEHIFKSSSDTTTSNYCQTEPVADATVPEKIGTHIPDNSLANLSLKKCLPSDDKGTESELSQERQTLQKYFSLHDQNEDLRTCSSTQLDLACEGATHVPGGMHPSHLRDLICEQSQLDRQSDVVYFTPQVDDILGYVSIERTVGQSAVLAPLQYQCCPRTADKEQRKALSNFIETFGQAKVVASSCPPLQGANSCGNEMARGDGLVKDRGMEDSRMSSSLLRERQENPAISCGSPAVKSSGDLKQRDILELLKLPNNQPELFCGQRPKDFGKKDKEEHVYQTGKQRNAWERSSTEDEIFLERFSATSNNLKYCELSKSGLSAHSNLRIESLGQPHNCSPDLTSQIRLSSAPGRPNCGRTESLYFDRSLVPAAFPSDVPLVKSLPKCVSTRSSLGETGRPHSSQEDKYERCTTFESKFFPDYAASCDCASPSSSVNRSLDNSERHFTCSRPCTDCLNKYEHQETCVSCAHGIHDWKQFATTGCFPSLMMHSSSFPAQCQSLLLNPRPNSRLSHTSQSSTQCRCDTCNLGRFSPPVLPSCHHPPCVSAVQRHRHCHFPESSYPVPISSHQPGKFRHTSTTSLHGQNVQCPKKETLPPYIPLQVIQPSRTCRPLSHGNSQQTVLPLERHQFVDKHRVTQDDQVGGQPKSNQTKDIGREQELVWLSLEEVNLIQQLRLLDEKAMARCRHDAAACIQRFWRKYLEKKTEDLKVENEQQAAASTLLTGYQIWHGHLQYCKLRQVAISRQLCGSSPKELVQGNLVMRLYRTMQKAARIIQRAWRYVLRIRKEKMLARRELPKDLKNFYDIIRSRHVARGRLAPSFGLFAKSVDRIQAATEGARVRRRLKSHRLQTIIMEIKEIRMLLCEMSQEENCNSTPFLFPQLCTQLRQKILQLHAALNGKQMEARFLLRRCPATPLTLHPSRSTSPKPICLVPNQKSVDQALTKLSSGAVGARKFYAPPLTSPASVISNISQRDPSTIQSAVHPEQKFVHTHSFVPLIQGSEGNALKLRNPSPDPSAIAGTPDSAKLLQWYFLAQRTPSKRNGGRGTPTGFRSGHEALVKTGLTEILDPSQNKCDLSFSSQTVSPKSNDPEYSLNKSFDEQPLPAPQRRSRPEMSFEEMVVGGSNASMYLTEYAPSTDSIDKPKRPFLKRKSRVMPPQKLDWSKVKPMVSSRLEPELKTKLSLCKGTSKEPTKNSSKKKANYSNVKSRLFSYEGNVSPSNSADETCLHLQSTETSEACYPPMLRGGSRESRGSSIQGTENSRNSRVLTDRQKPACPDLMHLRRSAEADRLRSQTAMLETQSVATYSSHFNSARYLHKLGNSEETSKGPLIGSCQQRTQRIRLRIAPRSKESEVGDLFVQEEMQEVWEDQSLSADGKGKRQQSHSHRYAIYQEQDATYSSRMAEATRPEGAEEDRNVTARASRKV